ncbi:MAG TPA: NADH-quinone oxidoreductase subunit K [Candidatus Bipolaricaulota bacterium]
MSDALLGAVDILNALLLLTGFLLVGYKRLLPYVRVYAFQSTLLAALSLALALQTGIFHLYVMAALTLLIKGALIPWSLFALIARLQIKREIETTINVPLSLLSAGALVVLAQWVAQPLLARGAGGMSITLIVSLALVLMGLFLMATRRKAITQIVGLLTMENGLFLTGVAMTSGMPMLVELGVLFDVFVGISILGIFVFRIRQAFDTVDMEQLRELKG